ncbi:ABC transporter ATP-binding protein [Parachlamydia sp.]|uniref:ABC transporter ATP-binding protein n=1 Tax=Parachlamydia sp. TaxID=2052048 RepID=UPI003D146FDF
MAKLPSTFPKFIRHFLAKQPLKIVGLILVACYWAASFSLSPYALKVIIDRVNDTSTNPTQLFNALLFPAIFYVGLGLSIGIVFRFNDWLILKMIPQMKAQITQEMFDYVEKHSYEYFQHHFSGSLTNKINDMAKSMTTLITNSIQYAAHLLSLVTGSITLYFINPYFSYILITWGVLFISISLLLARKSQEYAETFSYARSSITGKIVDSLSNILNIKLFAHEKYESRYLQEALKDTVTKDQNLQWYLLKVKCFYTLSITCLVGCMTWLLIYERSKNNVTVGDFALVLTLTMWIIEGFFFLANNISEFSEDIGTCTQSLSIISPPHGLVDKFDAPLLHVTKGEIRFNKVHFHYKKRPPIFMNKSVTIRAGEKVGLVGFSGSGKSSFVNLILRFFDIQSGQILIDDQNIADVTQESLRSQVSMIPQDPILFHRTLMENIRYGRLDATDEQVITCSIQANCHEFIDKLPQQYNTLVGERGIKLSGGQRQRIAIARALLKNAPILILDEATSSLDSVTEHYIQESLLLLMQKRTTIVIAHRLSTLFHMDRILVFSHGKIIEQGTHIELLKLNGQYATLWNMQAGGFLRNT